MGSDTQAYSQEFMGSHGTLMHARVGTGLWTGPGRSLGDRVALSAITQTRRARERPALVPYMVQTCEEEDSHPFVGGGRWKIESKKTVRGACTTRHYSPATLGWHSVIDRQCRAPAGAAVRPSVRKHSRADYKHNSGPNGHPRTHFQQERERNMSASLSGAWGPPGRILSAALRCAVFLTLGW